MEGIYPIELSGREIGQAEVTRQGLYYHFTCRCRLTGEVICRLAAVCGDQMENLGVPVPENGYFVLQKNVPVSKLQNTDYKTALQELVQQKKNQTLCYRLVGESGPDHDKVFTAQVLLNDQVVGEGTGSSKKRAEQDAARTALEKLKK